MRHARTSYGLYSSLLFRRLSASSGRSMASPLAFLLRPYASGGTHTTPSGGGDHHVDVQHVASLNQDRILGVEERARSLVSSRKSGTFTTVRLYGGVDAEHDVALPLYGSLMPYILDDEVSPVVAIRPDEKHYINLQQMDLASLVVYPLTPKNINPSNFALPRVNLGGKMRKLERNNAAFNAVQRRYLASHPGCKKIIEDLIFYKMDVEETIYCSGGIKETTHIPFNKYKSAKIDVVMQGSRSIIEWMNEPKREIYLKLFCEEYANVNDVGEIFMFSVDRKGFEVMAWRQSNRNWIELHFPFPYEMQSVDDCKGGLLDSCSFLYNKYLKGKEGVEQFNVEEEWRREHEQQVIAEDELQKRHRESLEPELWR